MLLFVSILVVLRSVALLTIAAPFAQTSELCGTSSEYAKQLEQELVQTPGNQHSRAELLDFYLCQGNLGGPSTNPDAYTRHLLWFIEHSPRSYVLRRVEGLADPGYVKWLSAENYLRVYGAWERMVKSHPNDATILAHAARGMLLAQTIRDRLAHSRACARSRQQGVRRRFRSRTAAKAFRLSEEHDYYRIRAEYCHSVAALALLRMGNIVEAEKWALTAVKAAPKKPGKHLLFAPRILYAACVVESHAGKIADAEAFCNLGLQIAAYSKLETRDLSLGYLALAEAYLQADDLVHSRGAVSKSADLTKKMFGTQHQDMIDALDLLAMISLRQGDKIGACNRAREAINIANVLFGVGSAGSRIPARVLQTIEAAAPRESRTGNQEQK